MTPPRRVLVVGGAGGTHVGQSFVHGAARHGVCATLLDSAAAHDAPWLLRQAAWRLGGRRPARLRRFGRRAVEECARFGADVVLTTGGAPLRADALRALRAAGARLVNFSTDDPFNPRHRARWFLDALREYDLVCTPRRANLDELRAMLPGAVRYLPFGYDPRFAHPEPLAPDRARELRCEVLFVGGADPDRIPFVKALSDAGIDVAMHGGFWERYPTVSRHSRGHASAERVREATRAADVSLCLVRRANRDGHVMRSFEIAASGGCMLVEDTAEHREIFGADGEAVRYFGSVAEMVERARGLLAAPEERARLADAARRRIAGGANTYGDRLVAILEMLG